MNASPSDLATATEARTPKSSAPLVFITGASSGLGQALALAYFQKGWRLALVARRTEAIYAWAQSHHIPQSHFAVYAADVADAQSINTAGQFCMTEQGVPDVVIACAGISHGVDTAIFDDLGAMQRIWATNNMGLAATFHPFIAPMATRGSGCLVGIASVAGIRGLPGHGAYSSSKAGVIAYCESLRGELRKTGVQVVTISPGFIDTPMTQDNPFPMPFLMPADQFAAKAYKAIARKTSYCVIPWQMGWLAKLLRVLPNWLFDRALAGRERKPRDH